MNKFFQLFKNKIKITLWNIKGKPLPAPHASKQLIIQHYQKKYKINIFIETGTFLGDMVWAQLPYFKYIYSIELSLELAKRAQEIFKKYNNIHIIQGDSSDHIAPIIKNNQQPCLFWLDGHYSGGITALGNKACPIFEELANIASSKIKNHVILIDDVRCFNGMNDYPKIEAIEMYIKENFTNHHFFVESDILVILPN